MASPLFEVILGIDGIVELAATSGLEVVLGFAESPGLQVIQGLVGSPRLARGNPRALGVPGARSFPCP